MNYKGLKLLEICVCASGSSRVEAVAETVVAEAVCTKSMVGRIMKF